MNYEDMTDFEINALIAKYTGFNLCKGQHYKPGVAHWSEGECKMFDACNNPGDAWTIIQSAKINLLWDTESTEWEAQAIVTTDMYFPSTCEHFYYDKNPLRAAMIVYLMMNEDKK